MSRVIESADETVRRKDAHLDLCVRPEVEPQPSGTLFDSVQLVHNALPELRDADLDLRCEFLGKPLRAPILITGMTGGTPRAGEVNRALAAVAEAHGIAFGVGSQRAMLQRAEVSDTYRVRDAAPTVPLLGNIGLGQAIAMDVDAARRLVDAIGGDGLAVHLNVAQEMAQREGDRDFRGGLKAIEALARAFGDRLVVKETGCGIAPAVCERLVSVGVKNIDVSGAGGTSWVKVEVMRGGSAGAESFATWGIPTAAAISAGAKRVGARARLIASGGIRDGLHAAKALALGADLVGLALPMFRAQQDGGIDEASAALNGIITGLRTAMMLTGCRTLGELRSAPRVVTGTLRDWLEALG